jgi:hypothetical protein
MNKFARISLIVLLLLLIVSGSAYGWWALSNQRKLSQLQQEMAAAMEAGQRRDPANRERFREIREQINALPEDYQKQFRQGMRERFQAEMKRRMDEYYALSKEDRRKELFKRIAEDEKRRKEWEARRKQREASGETRNASASRGGGGGPGGRGGAGGPNGGGNGSGGQGNGGQGNGQGGSPGGRGGGLAARLDNSSPEMRAQMAGYMRDMNQARLQSGLPPVIGHRGGGRGPR